MVVLPARQTLPAEELPPVLNNILSKPLLYGSQWKSGINYHKGELALVQRVSTKKHLTSVPRRSGEGFTSWSGHLRLSQPHQLVRGGGG